MNQSYCDINISYHHNNGEEKVRKLHKISNAVGYKVYLCHSFGAPLVLLWAPYGESEVSWGRDGDLKDVCASGNICSCTNEAGFTCSRTCVHGRMIICPVSS